MSPAPIDRFPAPFDKHSAALLRACGYEQFFEPAHWEDVGDAENGPRLSGHDGFQVWSLSTPDYEHQIYVVKGEVVGEELLPPEDWFSAQRPPGPDRSTAAQDEGG